MSFRKDNRLISEDTCSPDKFVQHISYPAENVAFCWGIAIGVAEWCSVPSDAERYSTSKRSTPLLGESATSKSIF
jgi:hypothetical protein